MFSFDFAYWFASNGTPPRFAYILEPGVSPVDPGTVIHFTLAYDTDTGSVPTVSAVFDGTLVVDASPSELAVTFTLSEWYSGPIWPYETFEILFPTDGPMRLSLHSMSVSVDGVTQPGEHLAVYQLGGAEPQTILADPGGHLIVAGDGAVTFIGQGGNDTALATEADETLSGSAGDDFLWGRGGNDMLDGGDGDDTLRGGDSNDILQGGEGNDSLVGEGGTDEILGGRGDDHLSSWGQGSVLRPGLGEDTIGSYRGSGRDYDAAGSPILSYSEFSGIGGLEIVVPVYWWDEYEMNGDTHHASEWSYGTASSGDGRIRDSFLGPANIEGSQDDDTFILSSIQGISHGLAGLGGADNFQGPRSGSIYFIDYAAEHLHFGGSGSAIAADLAGGTIVDTQGNTDTVSNITGVRGSVFDDVITGAGMPGGVRLWGHDGDDTLTGSDHRDRLEGGHGDDVILAGAGDDIIVGGAGNDIYDAGEGRNKLIYNFVQIDLPAGERVDVEADLEAGLHALSGGALDADTLTGIVDYEMSGTPNATVRGTSEDNSITTDHGEDLLVGLDGNDQMEAGAGRDTLHGGEGDDLLIGGAGSDIIHGGAGDDTLVGDEWGDKSTPFGAGELLNTLANFGPEQGWASQDRTPRLLGDIDGDGTADIVGFGGPRTFSALNDGLGAFASVGGAIDNFSRASGWKTQDGQTRLLGDVDGDGDDDIIGFGFNAAFVARSNGDGTFSGFERAIGNFANAQGWKSDSETPRLMADLNGDGVDDIIGFGSRHTFTALGRGDGTYEDARVGISNFTKAQGWTSNDAFLRLAGDINGDGMADIVGFGVRGTFAALSRGDGTFGDARLVLDDFGRDQGWGSNDATPRALADVNGDGIDDIVGFGFTRTVAGLGIGDGTFAPSQLMADDFSRRQGWTSQEALPRQVADLDGDGSADLVGFTRKGVLERMSTGSTDVFVFEDFFGRDEIRNFRFGADGDRIDFSQVSVFDSFEDVVAAMHTSSYWASIRYVENTLMIRGANADEISAADFLF